MDYIITTDSNSDVPSEVLNQYGIPVIPQYYAFGDVVYGDEKKHDAKRNFMRLCERVICRNPWPIIRQ